MKEKESLCKKVMKILAPSLFVIAIMFGAFWGLSAVVNAEEIDTEQQSFYVHNVYTFSGAMDLTYKLDWSATVKKGIKAYGIYRSNGQFIVYFYDNLGNLVNSDVGLSDLTDSYSLTKYSYKTDDGTFYGDNPSVPFIWKDYSAYTFVSLSTNLMIFDSEESIVNYITLGDDSGQINKPKEYIYDASIETPKLVFTDGLKFYINNSADDYFIEVQGRNYTVNDIELYKENLMWKYKYSSTMKNALSTWVSVDAAVSSVGEHDLTVYGSVSFSNLLFLYPIDGRNYYGGTNAIGNYFSGYSDALSTLKMLLNVNGSLYNGNEIYIRFYTVSDDGNIHYGKWCHWYDDMADAAGSSGSQWDDKESMFTENQSNVGLTDEEKNNIEGFDDSKKADDDATPNYNNTSSWGSLTGDEVWNIMQSLADSLGDFQNLITIVFNFLPSWLTIFISLSIALIVILRFLGR